MKKLFAIIISITIIFSCLNAKAEAINLDTQLQTSKPQVSLTHSIETKNIENHILTIEFLQQIGSWEELVNTAIPLFGINWNKIENKEDFYCTMLIDSIDNKMTSPIYDNDGYISYELSVHLKEIDYNRLMYKYDKIINIYNSFNNLQLVWQPKILNEDFIQINVKSTNIIDIEYPVMEIGQKVVLKNNSIYWESALNNGSGNSNIATNTNCYIPEDCIVTVNGFAYYSDINKTTIAESYYKPYNELTAQECNINFWKSLMIHICTETTDLGWVHLEDVIGIY